MHQAHAQFAQLRVQPLDRCRLEPREQFEDPFLVLLRHGLEDAAALRRQADDPRTPIRLAAFTLHQAVALELVGQAGDVAAGDHEIARQVSHLETAVAVQLREIIEARERDAKRGAQPAPHLVFDLRRACKQAQPELQRGMIARTRARFVAKAFVDVLQNPEFRAEKIEIAQKGEADSISRRNDDVGEISHRESVKLAYGPDNPYARVPEYATISAITRQDLIDWHSKYVHPNNMIVGISGDFDSAAMESRLRAAFDSWPKGPTTPKPDVKYSAAKPGYYLIPKDDVNQSNIRMVALGITRDNPDYYAISVFNEAFGGGFSSRLFNDIRTKRGLAYGVSGGVGANFGHPGIQQVGMGTKSKSTVEAVQAVRENIDNLTTQPITDDEIQHAKDAILNTFIFRLDSPDKILGERLTYEFYGYPPDWLDKYQAEIKKVTPADVNRVATKYMHKDQMAVLVVGNTKEFDKPLSTLGEVKTIDITIPAVPEAKDEAKPTASNPEGKALAAKVAASMGGLAKLQAIKSMRVNIAESDSGGPASPVDVYLKFPDSMHVEMQIPQGTLTIVASPAAAFMSLPGMGTRSMPPEQKTEMMSQMHHDLVYVAQHVDDPAFTFSAGGTEKIGEVDTTVVDVGGAIPWVRWYVDSKTGHVLREKYKGTGQSGPFEGETDLAEWRTVDGLTMPYKHENKQNGQQTSTAELKKIEVNPPLDPKLFDKPADKPAPQP